MLFLRAVMCYFVEHYTMANEFVWINFQLYMGVGLISMISLSQCFVNFKLAQLVYILPEKFKWSMVAA